MENNAALNRHIIHKAALAVIKDRKLLVVRTKGVDKFYALGGTIEEGESEIDNLHREVMEEISCRINPDSLRFLHTFRGPAYGRENTDVHISLFQGELLDEPKASSEIEEIKFCSRHENWNELPVMGQKIFTWLNERDLID